MIKARRLALVTTLAATLMGVFAFTTPANANAPTSLPNPAAPAASPVYTGAPNQIVLPITSKQVLPLRPHRPGKISPQLDPGTIALCNAGFGDVSVKSYQTPTEGKIDLFCGNASAGYVHIRTNHENDWQAQIDSLGGGANWDDWMEYQLNAAVTAPMPGYPISVGGNKSCYTTAVQIFADTGELYATFYPTIIVSQNNHLVVTAIPTTSAVANNCYAAQ